MLPVLEECWTRAKAVLRERAGEAAYAAWLVDLRPVLLERSTAYFEAPNRMAADRVRALFRPLLQEVLSADLGTELQVELQAHETVRFDELEVSPQHPVVDESNNAAHLLLKGLASGRPQLAGQFVFHGPSGVGKTFLLRWWSQLHPQRPMWFDLPALLAAFQATHQEGRVDGFREELLQDRPLVIDELHRVAGKPKLQQFLIHVLRGRESLRSPTLFGSRWHPSEIRDIEPTLATLLVAGFVVAIDRPGPLGRLRYLRALDGSPSRNGRAHVVERIARDCTGTYPELRASWARSRAAHAGGRTLPNKYLVLIDPARLFARLRDQVAERFGVAAQDLLGKGQGRAVSRARKVLAFVCLSHGLRGSEVGRFLGGRTRAAVSYMAKSLQAELATSPELKALTEGIS